MGAKDRFRTRVCPKCGWRGTENSSEKTAGFWQYGGLCAERQCRAAEKRRKKKQNDTAIEREASKREFLNNTKTMFFSLRLAVLIIPFLVEPEC